jgi:hypothetical protein
MLFGIIDLIQAFRQPWKMPAICRSIVAVTGGLPRPTA